MLPQAVGLGYRVLALRAGVPGIGGAKVLSIGSSVDRRRREPSGDTVPPQPGAGDAGATADRAEILVHREIVFQNSRHVSAPIQDVRASRTMRE